MSTESVRRRLAAAAPGPWEIVREGPPHDGSCIEAIGPIMAYGMHTDGWINATDADADLVVHAPTDLRLALDVIEASWNLRAAMFRGDLASSRDVLTDLTAALAAFEAAP